MIDLKTKKKRVRSHTRYLIKKGILKRECCRDCGNPDAEAHHPDYDKPTYVIWLCLSCHRLEHRKIDGLPLVIKFFCSKCGKEMEEERKGKENYCGPCRRLLNWAHRTAAKFWKHKLNKQ